MIVKINSGVPGEWKYFEGDQIGINVLLWGDRDLLTPNTISILSPFVKDRSEASEKRASNFLGSAGTVKIGMTNDMPTASNVGIGNEIGYTMKLILVSRDKEEKAAILTDCISYLLNDNGKTIDRIN